MRMHKPTMTTLKAVGYIRLAQEINELSTRHAPICRLSRAPDAVAAEVLSAYSTAAWAYAATLVETTPTHLTAKRNSIGVDCSN